MRASTDDTDDATASTARRRSNMSLSSAFDKSVPDNVKAKIASESDVEALRATRDAARRALASAELAYATAALSIREMEKNAASEANAGAFGSMDEIGCERSYYGGTYIDVEAQGVPKGLGAMASDNFVRELRAMVTEIRAPAMAKPDTSGTTAEMSDLLRAKLDALRLDADAIWDREANREQVAAPWVIKAPYLALCVMLDKMFDDTRPIQRFWFLETVARMPYFSYTSMLTLYEILGWWRRGSELRRVHFAEEWNEYHHLLIMESLGGDALWRDRFLGQHAALAYYIILITMWLVSPALAYNFSELIEAHAVDTYAQFVDQNEEVLKSMPPSRIAREYYQGADLFLFDEFQTSREARSRRPEIKSMYDVFSNIRDDEGEHVSTMHACQIPDAIINSPNAVNAKTAAIGALVAAQIWFSRVAETGALGDAALDDELMSRADWGATDGIFDALFNLLHFF